MSRKELKILDSDTLYFVSGFRRNYNYRLLKLALVLKIKALQLQTTGLFKPTGKLVS
jgi:hypothetical protein